MHLAAFSTPLNLFNCLQENSESFVVLDDCSGIFNDVSSMAILKAATWPLGGRRMVRWGSTTSRAVVKEFEFKGKLIIVCNSFPKTPDGVAVRSRSFPYRIDITLGQAREFIKSAATDGKWFSDANIAISVAEFLSKRLNDRSLSQMNYRTLQMGYELALHNSEGWRDLLGSMIEGETSEPEILVQRLAERDLMVKDQARIFEEVTGLKRRSFFNYRKAMGIC